MANKKLLRLGQTIPTWLVTEFCLVSGGREDEMGWDLIGLDGSLGLFVLELT